MINTIRNESPKKWKTIDTLLYLTIASIILTFSTRFFINIVGTFTPGIAGVAQGITYTLWNVISNGSDTALGMSYSQFVNNFYVLINWTLNIPIIIFSFSRVGKRFSYYSLYVMANTIVFTILLANIPGVKEIFNGSSLQELKASNDPNDLMLQYCIFIIIGAFGGVLYGYGCGLVFKAGYSTMGFDPIAKYLEVNKSININKTLFIFSMLSSTFWIIVVAITSGQINDFSSLITYTILSPSMATTIVFIGTYAYSSNWTYPSTRKVSVEIISKEYDHISNIINDEHLAEGHTLRKIKTGYAKNDIESIFIIINQEEAKYLINDVKKIDPYSVITVQKIEQAFMNIKVS